MPREDVRTVSKAMRTGNAVQILQWIGEGMSTQRIVRRLSAIYPRLDEAQLAELVGNMRNARRAGRMVRQGNYQARRIGPYAPVAYKQSRQWRYQVLITVKNPRTGEAEDRMFAVDSSRALSNQEIDDLASDQFRLATERRELQGYYDNRVKPEYVSGDVFAVTRKN